MPYHRSHTALTDEELLQRYRESGNAEWLGHLLQRYTMLMLGVALKYLKQKEQAEDAVQHVFYKTLTHLPEGEILNFKGWLYVLMRNHCLQLLREKNYKLPEEALLNLSADEETKEERYKQEYTLEQLSEALKMLNDDQRIAIEMFYLKKMSYQQIMEKTGFSFMQVKSFIQNGKRNLKLILNKRLRIGLL